MLAAENRTSLWFGVPGLLIQILGNAYGAVTGSSILSNLALLVGTVMLIVGLAFYAKAKGHSPAWGALGLLSIVGLIVLALLPDRHKA